jgi:NAD(P)H-hydrate repair Nnr-like enzyme with NAD(P)H-hydrate dehydratase domain
MAWEKVKTTLKICREVDVELDLSEIENETLLQLLIEAEVLSEKEAEQLLRRADDIVFGCGFGLDEIDADEVEAARAELMAGRRGEALIHLERALGGDFTGRLAVA